MPGVFQGLMTFPGIKSIISGTFTLSAHGIVPSVVRLTITPQPASFIPLDGTLAIYQSDQGIGKALKFTGCRIDQASFRRDANGLVWYLHIHDRRWRWAFGGRSGPLYGCYNRRMDDGTLDPFQLRTPKQLCKLCLEAMGEGTNNLWGPIYNVDDVPDDTNPEVNWEAANPAQELLNLCDLLGCRIVYQLDNAIAIRRLGLAAGARPSQPLPTVDVEEASGGLNPPRRPDSIKVVCGANRYQADFVLGACGQDTDGKIKDINSLSYTPLASSWRNESCCGPTPFPNVPDHRDIFDNTQGSALDCAQRTVYRWYGILNQNPDGTKPFKLPGYGALAWMKQVSPVEDFQVQAADANIFPGPDWAKDPQNPRSTTKNSLPARIYGIFVRKTGTPGGISAFTNTPRDEKCPFSFGILHDVGNTDIVEFDEYVYRYDPKFLPPIANPKNELIPAVLFLRAACNVRNPVTWALEHYERTYTFPGPLTGAGPLILSHPEIVLQFAGAYDPLTGKLKRTDTNLSAVNTECDYYLEQAKLAFQLKAGEEVKYMGFKAIPTDGAVMQITWTCGGQQTCSTTVSRNIETASYVEPYEQRMLRANAAGNALERLDADITELRKGGRRGGNPS